MENHHLLLPVFFVFFIFDIIGCASQSANVPGEKIALDCGSTNDREDADGRRWIAEVNSTFSPSDTTNGSRSTIASPDKAVRDPLYSTARLSRSQFTYNFRVSPGPKFIRLHFFPDAKYGDVVGSDAFFTVQAGQFTLLKNFSAALNAAFSGEQFVSREFCIDVGTTQKLDITFIPSPNSYAFVNGIEVVSMPSNLYYTREQGTGTNSVEIGNNTALELYHRLNIGGEAIPLIEDYGMYRTWRRNKEVGRDINNYQFPLNYTARTPNYTAPKKVYQSAVSLNKDDGRNLTWHLPIHVGFCYLVRLHFCQFDRITFEMNENQSYFTVYINQKNMENETVDLVNLYTAVHKDYVLRVNTNSLNVTIGLEPIQSDSYGAILNGIEVFKLSNNSNLAVANPPAPAPPPVGIKTFADSANLSEETVIVPVVCSSLAFAILLSLAGFMVLWKLSKKKTNKKKKKKKGPLLPEQRCRCFTFEEILESTNYFNKKREIGVGGFGVVYKGIFEDEDLIVAIKRLNPESRQGVQEFKTEIELLSELRHYNLVSLMGYCIEGKEMLLVYEFMENGTFRDHLYDTTRDPLPWRKRLEICYGAARGLNYLHTGVEQTIIHRDVKTTNILLDRNWVAKVSDLGISKMGPNNTAISTAVKGTWGYLDPEYYRRFQVTEKSDVYSFGVVLFEVLCARKPLDSTLGDQQFKLTLWAQKCMEKGTVHQIIDPNLKGKISPDCLKQYLELATSCVNNHMKDRPTMAVVEDKLRIMIQLQEAADAAKRNKNKPDDDYSYPEESLSPLPSMVASLQSDSYKCHMSNMLSGIDFTASTNQSGDPSTSVASSTNCGPGFSDSMEF